jgi:polysaccharide deacetylase 2 family uncharacterized protein YibQ
MTKRTRRRRSRKRRSDFFQKNKHLLILMSIAALVVVSLVLFARMEERQSPPVVPPVKKPVVDYDRKVRAEVEALISAIAETGDVRRELENKPARYTVKGDLPSAALIEGFGQRLRQFPGNYSVRLQNGSSLLVEKSRQTQIIIEFVLPVPELPSGPLVTIIMDDLGRSTYTAEALIALPQPVTFSIIPGEPKAVQVAELAQGAGREIMLHAPMEPQGYPAVNPGQYALFVKYNEDEISRRFDIQLASVPYVTGINNHMGSRFTEDARALAPVMEMLQEKGLFFIDSRTTGPSRASEVARRFGVPTMDRDLFLDNVAEIEAISQQIANLEAKARRKGVAIGICHPYPETLEALRKELPGLAARGITLVPVSVLLQRQAMNQGS